ncbi:PREDICTED: epsin-3-like [Nelumbo nucifera]|uniref:Epsin-3-like n=2 Tax=Nelumbo nucifera TaxID=4432 RepID=A0A1U8A5M4_NELNU|nr:PREDICTED: epsin-3-like [Nelumbo nucifera]DAD36817.1 TPA_asm: hypothetical protein HUJ06_007458 [Nelumbo nucifera]
MESLSLGDIKKQASSFLQEKYKTVRLTLTDVTKAELLAEEATNNDPWGPDARTMTRIAVASYGIDDYWRIVDVLHRRLYAIDWKQWRQSYKSLVLLEFLLTHGPEDFAEEFQCDSDVIEELGTFKHIDEQGLNWGDNMQKKSERILQLLEGGEVLKEERFKALKISKEIQGFGNVVVSSSSSSSPSSSSSAKVSTSSFGSYSTSSPTCHELDEFLSKDELLIPTKNLNENYSQAGLPSDEKPSTFPAAANDEDAERRHLWDSHIEESGSLLDPEEEYKEEGKEGFFGGICSKLKDGSSPKLEGKKVTFRSLSDVGKVVKKTFNRQFSAGY